MSALKCWAGGALMLLALAQGSHAEMTVSQSNAPTIRLDEQLDALFGQERIALGSLEPDHFQRLARLAPPAEPSQAGTSAEALTAAPAAPEPATGPTAELAAPEAADAAPRVAPPAKAPAGGFAGFFAAFAGAGDGSDASPVPDDAFTESWLARQPAPDTSAPDLQCLTKAIYFEARGESPKGQAAVAEVILNRVESPTFPRTVCGVVNQGGNGGCQFSYTCDGRSDIVRERAAWQRASKIAAAMLAGAPRDLTDGATHFHTPKVRPDWARRFTRTAVIGRHIFYRQPMRTASN